MRGYLCGGINGLSDAEAMDWRERAKVEIPRIEWVDPMARDYRGRESENVRQIVESDLADIASCDILLVWAERPSWGTAMEIVYARQAGKRIVTYCPGRISPWLQYHSSVVVGTWNDVITALLSEVARP